MLISDINYRVENNLKIEVEFPEYSPNYPYDLSKYYTTQLQSSFYSEFTQQFCNIGPYMDIVLSDGLQFAAFFYPNACSLEKLKNLGIISTLFYFIDDIVEYSFGDVGRSADNAKPFAEMCCKVIDNIADIRKIPINEIQAWKPFMFALYANLYAIREQTGSAFWNCLTNALKDHVNTFIDECKIDEQSYAVDEATLLEFRLKNSGGYAFLCLIQYANGIEVTEEEWYDQLLQNVLNYAIKSLQMCNDLYSFRKEIKECNGMLEKSKNMIAVLMRTQCLTLQEAYDKQVVIIERLDELYNNAKQQLFNTNPSEAVRQLCGGIDYAKGGNWVFHLGAKRYNGANFKGCIPSSGKWIYSEHQTIIIAAENQENKFEKFQTFFKQ